MRSADDPGSRHLPALDGVRGLAIGLVLVHNLRLDVAAPSFGTQLVWLAMTLGWVGVTLFFALSGYLITMILLDTRGDPHYLRNFFARRALRIFPLYYVTLVVVLVLIPRLHRVPDWFVAQSAHQLWFWIYLSNWVIPFGRGMAVLDHFWSLAVEEQFYFVWPFVVRALGGRRLGGLCVALAIGALAARIALHSVGAVDAPVNYYWTVTRFDALTMGALLAVLTSDQRGVALLDRWLPRAAALIAGVLGAMVVLTKGFPRHYRIVDSAGYTLLAVGAALLVDLPLRAGGCARAVARRFFETSTLRWMGRYSYGIYVIHGCLDEVARRWIPARWIAPTGSVRYLAATGGYVLGVAGVSSALAFLSYHLFEKRFLALKTYFVSETRAVQVHAGKLP